MYLQLEKLHKSFDQKKVVQNLTLGLDEGQILCLLGSSGCGKTTTLKMISGLLTPDSGNICVDGQDITSLPPERRPVSTVFQSYSLFPNMTVLRNVIYGLKLKRVPHKEAVRTGMEYLELAGLTDYADSRIWEISGGQQQRVALMRALILHPKVLLLDEPLSNLDARLREKMRTDIRDLQRKFGTTMVFVTHDREEAMVISDKIAIMDEGNIIQYGSPEELYQNPANEFVMHFFGDYNKMDNLYIRPEQIAFDENGPIRGIIQSSQFLGFYRIYTIDTPYGSWNVLGTHEDVYENGNKVRLTVKK